MITRYAFSRLHALHHSRGLATIVVAIFALAGFSIIMGRWGGQFLSSATGMDLAAIMGPPSTLVIWNQWMSSLNQIVLLVIAIWAGHTAYALRRDGTAKCLLTKPMSREAILHTSWLVPLLLTVAIAGIGSIGVTGIGHALYSDVSWSLAASFGLWVLNVTLWSSIGALAGTLTSSIISAIVVPVAALLIVGIFSSILMIANHTFAGLFPLSTTAVSSGITGDACWPIISAGITIVLAISVATWLFAREDL
ncbi:ABC-type transport system involved in multi-copper enzyme maturation permease subunit [Trueperella bonasi]|uniref:ABC-type transport system involved in multi-copper enzyme maturation permease subunit n=1 Tax=Trueperella bonasi TaxID=312286 RepID=A0ABT9NEV6_9ACTO|nr:hypothetical protein [Trueperella bonasi]MDP9805900.1 ABC-type transport system involved in multi-copper enzyme maturation permease subunit [Trueperella bonasi]